MYYEQEKEALLQKQVLPQTRRDDFEEFWRGQVDALRQIPLQVKREKLDLPFEKTFLTYQISFNTHDATMVDAWFSVPANRGKEKLPCVVLYHGGGGKKEIFAEILATGVCCLAVDVRSQYGTTVDKAVYHSGDIMGSLMTCGILDKNEFYMRNIYLDAVRAMDVAASLEEVDPDRIVTFGGSQGGALSIVASALSGRSKKCYSAVTSYCNLKKRVEDASGIFAKTHDFLWTYPQYTDTVMENLTYFDILNMVSLLQVPVSFALALADPICLPPYVYSAYAHAADPKEITLYPFAPHNTPRDFWLKMYREWALL